MSELIWSLRVDHVLSTESEESMGLLLGDIEYSDSGNATALIWAMSPQTRSDWQKDRVETNPEQFAAASAQAERFTLATGRTTRVIGWYHSLPHVTGLPSHANVRKQAIYQLLDSGFIGLIFSCFNEDAYKAGRVQVIALQSLDGKHNHSARPISLSPVERSVVIDVETLSSSYDTSMRLGSNKEDQDTGDSRSFGTEVSGKSSDLSGLFAHADASNQRTGVRGNKDVGNSSDTFLDVERMDMSDSIDDGAKCVMKEIPLLLVPLSSFTDPLRELYPEEEAEDHEEISQHMRGVKLHPLTFIHHTSTYQASLCKLMDHCIRPGVDTHRKMMQKNQAQLRPRYGENYTVLQNIIASAFMKIQFDDVASKSTLPDLLQMELLEAEDMSRWEAAHESITQSPHLRRPSIHDVTVNGWWIPTPPAHPA